MPAEIPSRCWTSAPRRQGYRARSRNNASSKWARARRRPWLTVSRAEPRDARARPADRDESTGEGAEARAHYQIWGSCKRQFAHLGPEHAFSNKPFSLALCEVRCPCWGVRRDMRLGYKCELRMLFGGLSCAVGGVSSVRSNRAYICSASAFVTKFWSVRSFVIVSTER